MSLPVAGELRLLSENEYAPILQSHYPHLEGLSQDETLGLARWLREQRNRSRDLVRQRRRARRGKGPGPAESSERGLAAKKQVFANALRRVNARLDTLNAEKRRTRNAERLRAALHRREAAPTHHPGSGATAGGGMSLTRNRGIRVKVDPREVGRVSQFVKDAQARKDRRRAT
ncbi:hypothetical protein MVG78_16355 [Roseomonas gilardii subsp. gilardii]|uniref:hypothetical protein n=1 Tax=Roseomonas gilardii TaxID=257708 RepID=UPI001FF8606A|nr:hypothetical protein [Roseomonas gilardii]UPG72080.1 hypothetical protein MVG78_16355 [Roseomonas gilardii subsp. gilardii]